MRDLLIFANKGSFLGLSWRTAFGPTGMPDPYQTSIELGRLRLHIFWRPDNDPDFHDHMWDFWTFPLTSYLESYLTEDRRSVDWQVVPRFKITKRLAEHAHRVEGRANGRLHDGEHHDPVVTLVWRGPKRREWGFWVRPEDPADKVRRFIPWKAYVFGGRRVA